MFLTFCFSCLFNSPDGSCLNEVSIAQSIISQALPALSPRLSLSFSPKTSDRTRLVDSQSYPHSIEMDIKENSTSNLQASLTQLEATINANKHTVEEDSTLTPKLNTRNEVPIVSSPNKWPLKPGVLVHVNSNHTLSPKNQARIQSNVKKDTEDSNLGLLERSPNLEENKTPIKTEYCKKNGKPRKSRNVMSGIIKNLRKNDSSDDDSGKYKKINKSNKRAVALATKNYGPKKSIRSFFQSETPSVIVTEGGSLF